MKRTVLPSKGKTDWAKLKSMPDSEIRYSQDAPRTSPAEWINAVAHRGLPVPARKKPRL